MSGPFQLSWTREGVRRFGYDLALGAMRLIGLSVICALVLGMVLQRVTPTDATDAGWADRSGVRVRIDHGTGCEYLETSSGGITPRLNRSGLQICGAAQ